MVTILGYIVGWMLVLSICGGVLTVLLTLGLAIKKLFKALISR